MLEFEIQGSRYVGVGSFKETTSIYLWAVLWILIIRKDSLFHLWKNVYSTTYFQEVTHPSTTMAQCCLPSGIRTGVFNMIWP